MSSGDLALNLVIFVGLMLAPLAAYGFVCLLDWWEIAGGESWHGL